MTATATTCTVRRAVEGCCGKPAVFTFTGTHGEAFGECAEHFDPRFHAPVKPEIEEGARVEVVYFGRRIVGRVVRVGRTRCTVEITTVTRGVKTVERAIAEVKAV